MSDPTEGIPDLDGEGIVMDPLADAQLVPMDDAAGGPQADDAEDPSPDPDRE